MNLVRKHKRTNKVTIKELSHVNGESYAVLCNEEDEMVKAETACLESANSRALQLRSQQSLSLPQTLATLLSLYHIILSAVKSCLSVAP